MATLAGQRANFTWALNRYNQSDDPETRVKYAKQMAKTIAAAPANGFSVEQVTQGQTYPVAEVDAHLGDPGLAAEPGISEEQAKTAVAATVDSADALRMGDGLGVVYAYGYRCCPDRLKVGSTEVDTVQRIAAQIGTGTPDRPALYLEIRTNGCRAVERAIQSVLEARGRKIAGGGAEWFTTSRDEIITIYQFISGSDTA